MAQYHEDLAETEAGSSYADVEEDKSSEAHIEIVDRSLNCLIGWPILRHNTKYIDTNCRNLSSSLLDEPPNSFLSTPPLPTYEFLLLNSTASSFLVRLKTTVVIIHDGSFTNEMQ